MSVTQLNLELNETEMSLLKLTGNHGDKNDVHVGKEGGVQVTESGAEYTREKEEDSFMQRYKLINRFAIRSVACGNRVTLLLTVEGDVFQFGTMFGSYPPKLVIIDEEDPGVQKEVVQIAVAAPSIESHGDPNDHCACIINENGKNLYTWGSNDYGQLVSAIQRHGSTSSCTASMKSSICSVRLEVYYCITDTNQVYSFGLNSKVNLVCLAHTTSSKENRSSRR